MSNVKIAKAFLWSLRFSNKGPVAIMVFLVLQAVHMVSPRYEVVLYRRERPSLAPRWVRGPAYPGHPSGRWDDPPEPIFAPRSFVSKATPVSRVLHAPQPTVYRVWNGHSTFNAPSCC